MATSGMTQDFFKRFFVRPKDRNGRAYTHTFFTGGSFIVPSHEDEHARMLRAIERDIRANIPIFINEIASDIFRFFLDLDFKVEERLTDADVGILLKHTDAAIRRFFGTVKPEEQNPRLFEAIVLGSDSPAVCSNSLQLQTLLERVPLFSSNTIVQVLHDARVCRVDDEQKTAHAVVWDADSCAPPGSYQCTVGESGVVTLLTSKHFAFQNCTVPNKELSNVLIHGSPPSNAVDAQIAKDRIGPWIYGYDTTFRVSEDSYFVNTRRDASGFIKQGFHVIFPEMCVTIEQALYMREALIEVLTVRVGTKLAPRGWSEVIDNSVYATGKGLRMIGSSKAAPCPVCKGIKSDVKCQTCMHGKVDEGRPYVFYSLFQDGERNLEVEAKYRSNLSYQIKRSSIRTTMVQPTPGWALYSGCPKFGNMLETTVKEDGEKTHKITSRNAVFKTDQGGVKRSRASMTLIDDPAVHAMFEQYIRKKFCKQYKNLRVVKVTKMDGIYFINVAGEGQHFCMNKVPASEHTSNTIYFQCDSQGLCVRCHCPKPVTENRAKGPCKKFKSTYVSLDVKDMANLFGESYSGKLGTDTFLGLSLDAATKLTKTAINGGTSAAKR